MVMTRLEKCKEQLQRKSDSEKQLYLEFQLQMNHLHTYQEKTEFLKFYYEVKKNLLVNK